MTYQMRIRAVLCWSAGTDSEAGLAKRRRTSLLPDTSARSALSSRSSDYREDCGLTPVGAETLRTSCGLLIFVEETAEDVVSFDLGISAGASWGSGREGAAWPRLRCGR